MTMRIFARRNLHGWIHLWPSRETFEAGEASAHFFKPDTDPRWNELALDEAALDRLAAGELIELEDPGYLDSSESTSG